MERFSASMKLWRCKGLDRANSNTKVAHDMTSSSSVYCRSIWSASTFMNSCARGVLITAEGEDRVATDKLLTERRLRWRCLSHLRSVTRWMAASHWNVAVPCNQPVMYSTHLECRRRRLCGYTGVIQARVSEVLSYCTFSAAVRYVTKLECACGVTCQFLHGASRVHHDRR